MTILFNYGELKMTQYVDAMPGEIKQQKQRAYAVENRGKVYKRAALLPSLNPNGDVRQGLETEIFIPKVSKMLGIEHDKDIQNAVEKQFQKQFEGATLIRKSVSSVDFGKYTTPNSLLDYFNCDMCGLYNAHVAASFFKNQAYFEDGMRFPLTIKLVDRKDNIQQAIESVTVRYDHMRYVDKRCKNVPFDIEFGMSDELWKNMYAQIYLLMNSMPSKDFYFHRINIYKNRDVSKYASYMLFLDIELYDMDEDIRRRNKFEGIIKHYNQLCPTKRVALFNRRGRGRPKKKQIVTVPYHVQLGFRSRKESLTPSGKAKITRLAKKVVRETGRKLVETRSSMVAGLNRHFTEKSKARKRK